MATKQQISKCLHDTLEKARVFLGAGVGIDTEGAKTDKSNIDNFLEQARQRASLRLQKGLWDAERNRRIMVESIGSARESLAQDIANAIQAKAPQSKGKSGRHERAPGVTNKWIAQQFNQYAQPLITKCYQIKDADDLEEVIKNILPELEKQGRKYGWRRTDGEWDKEYKMHGKYCALCVFEPMRGGNKSGYATVGSITERQIKTWRKAYPDESNPEPKSGFHAGMLKDKASIGKAAKKWGDHTRRYALAFFEWRKTHTGTPRNQFRYNPPPVIHGAEHTTTSAPQS